MIPEDLPETRFTRSAGRSVAYQVCGQAGPDLVFTPGSFNNVDVWWEHPVTAGFLRALASFSRLILFDRRGTGASDPLPSDEIPPWEDWVMDLRAVLDAAGSERSAIFASLDGGPTALALAALEPSRVTKLVFYNTTARYRFAEDYPIGLGAEETEDAIASIRDAWGTEAFSASNYPDRADDSSFIRWYAKYQRASISRGQVGGVARAWFDIDARPFVPHVRAPALVLLREQYRLIPASHGEWLAQHLSDATLVRLAGSSALFARDSPAILDHVANFLTGRPVPALTAPDAGPSVRVDGYQFVRRVGKGGMGEVWEARSKSTERSVAIKLVRLATGENMERRLLREAQAMSAVRHPAVVRVHEVTHASDGTPAVVMELLEGETLAARLDGEESLRVEETASLLIWLASALGTAHAAGVVHRDLKPANVFLERGGRGPPVKVLDFGIAKVFGEVWDTTRLTQSGSLLGTPAYMAPEQLLGEPFDHRADIWALGMMALEMLTGVLPTATECLGQIIKMALQGTGWDPRTYDPTVPAPLSALVSRMLSREPSSRPSDLHEVVDVLAQYTEARPPAFGLPLSQGHINRSGR